MRKETILKILLAIVVLSSCFCFIGVGLLIVGLGPFFRPQETCTWSSGTNFVHGNSLEQITKIVGNSNAPAFDVRLSSDHIAYVSSEEKIKDLSSSEIQKLHVNGTDYKIPKLDIILQKICRRNVVKGFMINILPDRDNVLISISNRSQMLIAQVFQKIKANKCQKIPSVISSTNPWISKAIVETFSDYTSKNIAFSITTAFEVPRTESETRWSHWLWISGAIGNKISNSKTIIAPKSLLERNLNPSLSFWNSEGYCIISSSNTDNSTKLFDAVFSINGHEDPFGFKASEAIKICSIIVLVVSAISALISILFAIFLVIIACHKQKSKFSKFPEWNINI